MNVNDTMYINPYTFQPTSKRVTGVENRREIAELLRDETMFRVTSPEELMGGIGKPLNLAGTTSVNRFSNSVNFAEGASITLPGGYVLTVNDYYVAVSGGDPYNQAAQRDACDMASALTMILRNAGGTANTVAFSSSEYQKWTENVSKVMRYIGIDTSKPFTVNGMRYTTNSKGYFESAASTAAQEAYKRQIAANRTYEFADERTKKKIAYLTDYYLSTVPEDVKAAWQDALEETGINPFQSGYVSTLQQLSVEQDFLTGGNDNIFGDTLQSSINAVNRILDRIADPLGEVKAERREFLQQEKVFYQTLLSKLEKSA